MQTSAFRPSRALGMIMLLFVNICWGLSFIASKFVLTAGLPPMTLACARYILTTVILLPVMQKDGKLPHIAHADWLWLLLSALFGVTLYYFFEYTGMLYTTASTASLILAAIPIFSLVYSALFLRQRAGWMRWVCVVLSMLGVFLVIRFGAGGLEGTGSLKGNLLILCCCLCWVAYIQIIDRLRGKYSSLTLTGWQAIIGMITLIPFALGEKARWVPIPPLGWVCVAALALICSALCYFLYAEALGAVGPFTASLFININPIAAVIGGVLILGETIAPMQLIGGALIALSLVITSLPGRAQKTS